MAKHTAEFAIPRFSTAQGKVFVDTDARDGDEVFVDSMPGVVCEARQDSSFIVRRDNDTTPTRSFSANQAA